MDGPQTKYAQTLHAQKYRGEGETFREAMSRIAAVLAPGDEYHRFRDILIEQRFLPGGRIQAAIGSTKRVTAINCLAGSTRIITREYGEVTIEEVANQTVSVLDGESRWQASVVNSFGLREVRSVRFTSGRLSRSVESTDDHRWILADGTETTTECLRRGDCVAYLRHLRDGLDADQLLLGIRHGIVYGDGGHASSTWRHQLRLCGGKVELVEFFQDSQDRITYPPFCGGDPLISVSGSINMKLLPANPSSSYLVGFIRGWLATDGCVSTQPVITICVGEEEETWLRKWGPSVGYYFCGSSHLADSTNYGTRKKRLRFDGASLTTDDFLRAHHRDRFVPTTRWWRVAEIEATTRTVPTYCPRVHSTSSFVLADGIHTGQCFLSGVIEDSFVDGQGSIMARATQAATTMRMGGGIGYDFSNLRPRGDRIRKLGSTSSGPVSFMNIFNAVCLATCSSGHRRGAQMGTMRVDHPDIEEFVRAKQDLSKLNGFNLSVAVTDEFMHALHNGLSFDLRFEGRKYGTVDPAQLWDTIMRSTWDNAEPGVVFIDTINRMNNLWYCERIIGVNPCAEQCLPAFGACLLGSFNLTKYLTRCPFTETTSFDYSAFMADIPIVVAAMDRVTDHSLYPLHEQEEEQRRKRRMGIGVTGLANAIEAMGHTYGSTEFLKEQSDILQVLRDECYRASVDLAKARGPFHLFDAEQYCRGEFIKTLPDDIISSIRRYGIRNSHLLSIAPTGTISLCADNVSSGIEPVVGYSAVRTINGPNGQEELLVQDYGHEFLGVDGVQANDVTPKQHLDVLLMAQKYMDSAVSKTCSVSVNTSWDDFRKLYSDAWAGGAKGCTTYTIGGNRAGVVTACTIDPKTGQRSCE